ncbi:MAG: hypothetical protein NC452_11675 [Eubacterium sp.]|nr:hypothetical protein [Eubacterium sp.]
MDKSEGFNWAKTTVVLVVFVFQLILLFSPKSNRITYMFSNISIILGYLLDLFTYRNSFKEEKRLTNPAMMLTVVDIISVVLSLSAVIYIVEFSCDEDNDFFIFVLIFSLFAIGLHVALNIATLIYIAKSKDSFIR